MTTRTMTCTTIGLALAATAATATLAAASPNKNAPSSDPPAAAVIAPPDATDFAAVITTSTTQYANANGTSLKVERTDCVEPNPGRYMCSYALRGQSGPPSCHLIQAHWTPTSPSLYTITLAGRTHNCANLPDALHSLG
jgi:hypothetical protein